MENTPNSNKEGQNSFDSVVPYNRLTQLIHHSLYEGTFIQSEADNQGFDHLILGRQRKKVRKFDREDSQYKDLSKENNYTNSLLIQNQSLKNSTNTLLSIKNAIDVSNIIIEVSQTGLILSANSLFYRVSGYREVDLSTLSIKELRSGNMSSSVYEKLEETIKKGGCWKGELENRSKEGELFWTNTTIVPVNNHDAKALTFLWISADITEIKMAGQKISALTQKLKKELKKRTEDIKVATAELEAFSYSVSHDLRAPLRAIAGFSGLLKEEYGLELNEEATHYLSVIDESTKQMSQLIDDLLAFSKVGRTALQKECFEPKLLLKDIINKERSSCNKNTKFIIQNLELIYGDQKMIKLVFENLLFNAIKFSNGVIDPQIEIGSYCNEKELVFYVEDNGVGFDMRYANKLFQVFQRLHSSEEFEGTGVGLAIVERIIKKHGGKVWAKSVSMKKTTFFFSLPKRK